MFRSFFTILTICAATAAFSQETASLAPDQNPNYMISRLKYMNLKDSLLGAENTTVQETYKAYDWREARDERRAERREYRRQNSYFEPYYPPSVNYGWGNYGYNRNNRYYNNNYNNGYGWNRWGISIGRPFIGFRTGNWWFGF